MYFDASSAVGKASFLLPFSGVHWEPAELCSEAAMCSFSPHILLSRGPWCVLQRKGQRRSPSAAVLK